MGKTNKQQVQSRHHSKKQSYQHFKGSKNEGQGFANVRKSQVVSRYQKDFAKEKLKLKDWTVKLQKLYAESDNEEELAKTTSDRKQLAAAGKIDVESALSEPNQSNVSHDKGTRLNDTKGIIGRKDTGFDKRERSKKHVKVSSYHKQELEWKKKVDEKNKKLEEIEMKKKARDEAITKHKKEKLHRHKFLAKRNYKGQPNMSSRVELLLEQIVKKQQQT